MQLFVSDLSQEKLDKLRAIRARSLGGIGDVLDDRAEFASQIIVQVVDQCLLVHVTLLREIG